MTIRNLAVSDSVTVILEANYAVNTIIYASTSSAAVLNIERDHVKALGLGMALSPFQRPEQKDPLQTTVQQ